MQCIIIYLFNLLICTLKAKTRGKGGIELFYSIILNFLNKISL